jgi:hypothetical protein
MTKKWMTKNGRLARVIRERPIIISSGVSFIFLSPHFFVIFFLLACLGYGRHPIREAVILRVLAQPIFRIISGRHLQRAGWKA